MNTYNQQVIIFEFLEKLCDNIQQSINEHFIDISTENSASSYEINNTEFLTLDGFKNIPTLMLEGVLNLPNNDNLNIIMVLIRIDEYTDFLITFNDKQNYNDANVWKKEDFFKLVNSIIILDDHFFKN